MQYTRPHKVAISNLEFIVKNSTCDDLGYLVEVKSMLKAYSDSHTIYRDWLKRLELKGGKYIPEELFIRFSIWLSPHVSEAASVLETLGVFLPIDDDLAMVNSDWEHINSSFKTTLFEEDSIYINLYGLGTILFKEIAFQNSENALLEVFKILLTYNSSISSLSLKEAIQSKCERQWMYWLEWFVLAGDKYYSDNEDVSLL